MPTRTWAWIRRVPGGPCPANHNPHLGRSPMPTRTWACRPESSPPNERDSDHPLHTVAGGRPPVPGRFRVGRAFRPDADSSGLPGRSGFPARRRSGRTVRVRQSSSGSARWEGMKRRRSWRRANRSMRRPSRGDWRRTHVHPLRAILSDREPSGRGHTRMHHGMVRPQVPTLSRNPSINRMPQVFDFLNAPIQEFAKNLAVRPGQSLP